MEVLRIEGGTVEEYLELAGNLQQAGMEEEHRLALERGCFTYPDSARLAIQLAAALHRAGRVPEAVTQYEKAEELAAKSDLEALDDVFFLGRAECARDANERGAAAGYFRKAIDKVPKGKPERAVPAYCGLAILWLEDDVKVDEARELLRLAGALDKNPAAVAEGLGLYAAVKGDWGLALKEYQRAETSAVHLSNAFLLRLTEALDRNGQKQEAIARLEKAVALPNATPALRAKLDALRGSPQKVPTP
jgi:lipopolysaccharide biosynthesis regulator YciM